MLEASDCWQTGSLELQGVGPALTQPSLGRSVVPGPGHRSAFSAATFAAVEVRQCPLLPH